HALEGTLYHGSIARFAFLESAGHVLTSSHCCRQLSGSPLQEPDAAKAKRQECHGHFVNLPPLQIACPGGEPFIHIEETTQGKDQERDTKNDQNIITLCAVRSPRAPGLHPMPPGVLLAIRLHQHYPPSYQRCKRTGSINGMLHRQGHASGRSRPGLGYWMVTNCTSG